MCNWVNVIWMHVSLITVKVAAFVPSEQPTFTIRVIFNLISCVRRESRPLKSVGISGRANRSSLWAQCQAAWKYPSQSQTAIDVIPPNDCHKSSALSGHSCGSGAVPDSQPRVSPIGQEPSHSLKYRIFYKCTRAPIFVKRKYSPNDLNIENKSFQLWVRLVFQKAEETNEFYQRRCLCQFLLEGGGNILNLSANEKQHFIHTYLQMQWCFNAPPGG